MQCLLQYALSQLSLSVSVTTTHNPPMKTILTLNASSVSPNYGYASAKGHDSHLGHVPIIQAGK